MKEFYISVYVSEDGDVWFSEISDIDEFLKEITEKDKFLDTLKENGDPMYWDSHRLLIKGKVVVPKSIQVTTKYEVE